MRNSFWLLALALACNNGGSSRVKYLDGDGDGYRSDRDCDDQSAAISPDAEERCNGIDDDCDGLIDEEGAVDGVEAFEDLDGDGFGEGEPGLYCLSDTGMSIYPGDCDDTDPDISPEGTELCDGVDDDCDGLIDEPGTPDGTEYPIDRDGDGYGHPVLTGIACAPEDGFADNATDCDDGDPSRHPDAPEDCIDGVDDDCDGIVDETDDPLTPTWYADSDGDGYGGDLETAAGCAPPAGYMATVTDCDDSDSDVHPDQPDATDDIDNDCDGVIDEKGDMVGTGTLEYEEDTGRTSNGCKLVWDAVWTEVYPTTMGNYAWHVDYTWNESASHERTGCSYAHMDHDFTWDVALYWHSPWDEDAEMLWVRDNGEGYWLPRFHSAFSTVSGHLRFSADAGSAEAEGPRGSSTTRTISGEAYMVGL